MYKLLVKSILVTFIFTPLLVVADQCTTPILSANESINAEQNELNQPSNRADLSVIPHQNHINIQAFDSCYSDSGLYSHDSLPAYQSTKDENDSFINWDNKISINKKLSVEYNPLAPIEPFYPEEAEDLTIGPYKNDVDLQYKVNKKATVRYLLDFDETKPLKEGDHMIKFEYKLN